MIDLTTVPIGARSVRFPVGQFRDIVKAGDAATCASAARAARLAAESADNPLYGIAQAAWYAAAAEHIAADSLV